MGPECLGLGLQRAQVSLWHSDGGCEADSLQFGSRRRDELADVLKPLCPLLSPAGVDVKEGLAIPLLLPRRQCRNSACQLSNLLSETCTSVGLEVADGLVGFVVPEFLVQ